MADDGNELMSAYPPTLIAHSQLPPNELFASSEPIDCGSFFGGASALPEAMQCDENNSHSVHVKEENSKPQQTSTCSERTAAQETASGAKPRKKLWQCVYPGCVEPPKTHYNCHSHVWDAHVRHQLPPDHPLAQFVYKKLPDRNAVKGLCRSYMIELEDNDPSRKRRKRPYITQQQPQQDSHLLNGLQNLLPQASNPGANALPSVSSSDDGDEFNDAEAPVCSKKRPAPSLVSSPQSDATNTLVDGGSPGSNVTMEQGVVPVVGGVKVEYPSYSLDPNDVVRIIHMSPELQRLHVCGEVFSERGFLQRSDARFKQDIEPIRGALDRVLQITGKTFRYKGDSSVKMGFIAQELEAVVPTAVFRDDRGLSVDVVSLVPLLLEALKELHNKTLAGGSDQINQLNAAVTEAMLKVSELDRKFEEFRNSDSDNSTDDDEIVFDEMHRRKNIADSDTSIELDDVTDGKRGSKHPRKNEGKKANESKKNEADEFRYKFSFGPALAVFFFGAASIGSGFATWALLPTLPFVWCFAWGLGLTLLLSLLSQVQEIKTMFLKHEIPLYWSTTNSLNWYCVAVVALIGATVTLILGIDSIYLIGILVFVLLLLCVFSYIVHYKYHVRVQSLFVVFCGFLVFSTFFFGLYFMSHPFSVSFEGFDGPKVTVNVRVGQPIEPITLSAIPWNCFFPEVTVSSALPSNISLVKGDSNWFFSGVIESLFNPSSVEVVLQCSGIQQFSYGELLFLPCIDYANESDCKSNLCAWCAAPNGGYCGFCTKDFESECYSSTGMHTSCYSNDVRGITVEGVGSASYPRPNWQLILCSYIVIATVYSSKPFDLF